MKKLFTIALMLLAQTVLFAAASVSIEQKTNAIPGALNVSVDANFSSVPQGVGAFTLYISFDNNVLDSPVLFNPVFAGIFSSTSTSGTTTTITVLWEDFNAPTTLSGKLFDIGFNYKGGNSNLTILGSSSIGDANANLLNASFINGSVTQIAITPGISVNNGILFNSLPYKTVDIPVYGHQLYNIGGFDLKLALSTAILTGNVTIVNRRTDLTAKGSWSASYNSGNIFVIWTKNPALDNVSIPNGEKLFDIRFNYTYGNSNISFVGTTNQIAQNVPPFYPEFGNAYFTSGSIATTPANPTVTYPTVTTTITYGQTLADAGLNNNGSASYTGDPNAVAGTFAFQNPGLIPGAGTYQATVVFTPTNSVAYNSVTGTVNVVVNKANQTISWSNPEAIPFGTPLSSAQLNAIVTGISGGTAPGSLSYAPSAGTILSSGTHLLTVTAAETVNYLASTFSVQIVVLESTMASLTGQLKLFGDPGTINPFNYPSNFYVQLFDGDNPVGAPQLIQTGSQFQIQGLYQYHGLDITKNYTLRLWETSPDNLLSNTWTWNNWNGITALDAFIMQSMIIEGESLVHFPWIGLAPFTAFSEKLADVNNSGTLTALDPLIILYRVVGFPGTSPFPGGRHNFVFAGKKLETLNDCAFPNAPDIMFESFGNYQANSPANSVYHEAVISGLVPGQNVVKIYMNVAGDMNASFMPSNLKSAPRIQYQQQINTAVGSLIDIPVMVDKGVNLNAVTIGMRYDKNLIRVNSINGFDLYTVNHDEGTIKIAWSNVQSKKMSDNEVLFYLNATILAEMSGNETYIELLPMTELVESGGLINTKTGLTTRSLSTLRDVDPSNTQAMIAHHFYPNPFNESGSLNISLPAKGKLNISLFNQYGQIVKVLTEEMAEAGMFNLQLNRAQLNGSGIYTYRIMLQTDEKQFVGHGNVILLK